MLRSGSRRSSLSEFQTVGLTKTNVRRRYVSSCICSWPNEEVLSFGDLGDRRAQLWQVVRRLAVKTKISRPMSKLRCCTTPACKISGAMSKWMVWGNSQFDAWKFLSFLLLSSPRTQVASSDAPHAQYVIIRRSGQGSAFWGLDK